jgi:tetratricopeptide (TPR) repeat protein
MRLIKFLFILLPFAGFAQKSNTKNSIKDCDTLIINGDFKAALECLEPLYEKNPSGPAFEKLLDTRLLMGDSAAALKLVRKQNKKFGASRPQYTVDHWVLSQSLDKRGPTWEDIELEVIRNPYTSRTVVRVLEKYGLLQEAVNILELAESKQPKLRAAFERAQLHAQLGQIDQQYEAYLEAIEQNRSYLANIKLRITQNINDDEQGLHVEAAKKALLSKIKEGGNVSIFENLLLFVFREEGDFDRAFRWLKAKSKSNDFRAYEFISVAREAIEMDQKATAIEVYDFMIYNRPSMLQGNWLNEVLKDQLELLGSMKQGQAEQLIEDFKNQECGSCFGWELAREEFIIKSMEVDSIAAFDYGNTMERLRTVYSESLWHGLTYKSFAEILQLTGDFDRALIEYARAETLLGDSKEGDESRLARAMCAFYSGDIDWAKTQLEVLLQSTSKEIANDALENALLIAANTVEDTLFEGLQLLRVPMLLEVMNKNEEALVAYEKAERVLLANEVYDDLLYKKGRVQLKLGKFHDAANTFLVLQGAAGEGMWKEESFFYYAKCLYNSKDDQAQQATEEYLLNYPGGFYYEQARLMYRTFDL